MDIASLLKSHPSRQRFPLTAAAPRHRCRPSHRLQKPACTCRQDPTVPTSGARVRRSRRRGQRTHAESSPPCSPHTSRRCFPGRNGTACSRCLPARASQLKSQANSARGAQALLTKLDEACRVEAPRHLATDRDVRQPRLDLRRELHRRVHLLQAY